MLARFTLEDAQIFVDIHKQRLVVVPIAVCDQIALVWIIDNLTEGAERREEDGAATAPVVRSVIRDWLQPLTAEDRAKLEG